MYAYFCFMEIILKKLGLEESKEVNKKVLEAVKSLPDDIKNAIELNLIQRVPRKQIALDLGWSLSKVNQKIIRGITLLKSALNPDYYKRADQMMHTTAQRLLLR